MSYKSVNPATGKVLKTYKEYPQSRVNEMMGKAAAGFKIWKKLAIPVRAKYMRRVGELLEQRKQEYAKLITQEMGKPVTQSVAEVEKCAWVCNYYAENAKIFLKDEIVKTEAEDSYITYEPLGVILAVMPWNFPFWQVFRFAAPTLMAGNAGILKHASNVPDCALAIEQIFTDAEFPEGVFQNVFVSSGNVKKLIDHSVIAAVTLTGSERAGSKVAESAGKAIKKTVLELGGSDAFIVLKEANLKKAAQYAVKSRLVNTGQSCIAAKRFIVEDAVADSFIKLMKQEMEQLKTGDPTNTDTLAGPIAREDLVKELHKQVQISIKKGAKLITGGERIKRKGFFYKPTLLTDVKPGMPVFDQETFGPVAAVIKVAGEQEAVEMANNHKYGLGASIWTENKELALRMAKQIEAGFVSINDMVKSDPRLPFGGVKKSGYGRELSEIGIKEFVNIKSIVRLG